MDKKQTFGAVTILKELSPDKILRITYRYESDLGFTELGRMYCAKVAEAKQMAGATPEFEVEFGTYPVLPLIISTEIFWSNSRQGNILFLNEIESENLIKAIQEINNLPGEERELGEIYS